MSRIPNVVALLGIALLAGCAMNPSCSVGLTFYGPIPVPHAGCDMTFEPEDDEEEED